MKDGRMERASNRTRPFLKCVFTLRLREKKRGWDIQTRNLDIEQLESKTLQKAVVCTILQRPFPCDLNTIPASFCNGGCPLVKSLPPGLVYQVGLN
jgi:hypothetical protein